MNIYEDNNLIIRYSEKDKKYIDEIINVLNEKSKHIMNFFKLENLSKKVNIVIWDSKEKYIEQLEKQLKKIGREYKEWMKADTFDGNINMMNIEDVKTIKNREKFSLNDFLESICHEFVHICQKETNGSKAPTWVKEMLATNLGNPSNNKNVYINTTITELNSNFDNIKNNYSTVYTIGKYLLKKYGEDYIYNIVNSEEKIKNELPILFEEAKDFVNTKDI